MKFSERHRGHSDRTTYIHQKQCETVEGLLDLLPEHLAAAADIVKQWGIDSGKPMSERKVRWQESHRKLMSFFTPRTAYLPEALVDEIAGFIRMLNGQVQRFADMLRDQDKKIGEWSDIHEEVIDEGPAQLNGIKNKFRTLLEN